MQVLGDQRRDIGGSVDAAVAGAVRHATVEHVDGVSLRLWVLGIASADTASLATCLDEEETRRAASYRRAEDRARYVVAHGALRVLLADTLGVAPTSVAVRREPCPACGRPGGRPAVDGPGCSMHFSIATRLELAVVAIASAPVGVDVEAVATPGVAGEVATLLHPAERAELHATAPAQRGAAFARLWVRKEAYLKGCGVGVAHGLDNEYLGVGDPALLPADWSVLEVPVPPGYAAAAALRTAEAWRWR